MRIMRNLVYATVLGVTLACSGCSDFLEDQVPQGTIDNEQLQNPDYVDNLVISITMSARMMPIKEEMERRMVMSFIHWISLKVL